MEEIASALIFTRTRIRTGELVTELNQRGYPSEALSGDLSQDAREHTMARFRSGQVKVLVATDVAARGLDVRASPTSSITIFRRKPRPLYIA
jgi:ATP-dependent RNA helicase DeaD